MKTIDEIIGEWKKALPLAKRKSLDDDLDFADISRIAMPRLLRAVEFASKNLRESNFGTANGMSYVEDMLQRILNGADGEGGEG